MRTLEGHWNKIDLGFVILHQCSKIRDLFPEKKIIELILDRIRNRDADWGQEKMLVMMLSQWRFQKGADQRGKFNEETCQGWVNGGFDEVRSRCNSGSGDMQGWKKERVCSYIQSLGLQSFKFKKWFEGWGMKMLRNARTPSAQWRCAYREQCGSSQGFAALLKSKERCSHFPCIWIDFLYLLRYHCLLYLIFKSPEL